MIIIVSPATSALIGAKEYPTGWRRFGHLSCSWPGSNTPTTATFYRANLAQQNNPVAGSCDAEKKEKERERRRDASVEYLCWYLYITHQSAFTACWREASGHKGKQRERERKRDENNDDEEYLSLSLSLSLSTIHRENIVHLFLIGSVTSNQQSLAECFRLYC